MSAELQLAEQELVESVGEFAFEEPEQQNNKVKIKFSPVAMIQWFFSILLIYLPMATLILMGLFSLIPWMFGIHTTNVMWVWVNDSANAETWLRIHLWLSIVIAIAIGFCGENAELS